MTLGTRCRYFSSMRVAQRSWGSLAWQSAETMKYFRGSPGRAVRAQPVWPGVASRHRFGSLTTTSVRVMARSSRRLASSVERAAARTAPLAGSPRPPNGLRLALPFPLYERERRRGVVVRLEHRLHRRADRDLLRRVSCQVPDHAHVAGLGQLDQHDDVRSVVPQRRMHRVPGALPRIDAAAWRHRHPLEIEGEAAVADPLRSPLKSAAGAAALHAQLAAARALPVRSVELVWLRHRPRHAWREHERGRAHSVSSVPSSMLETGVTIGPEITRPTRARCTWLVDWPRSWR